MNPFKKKVDVKGESAEREWTHESGWGSVRMGG